jgi:hypothetical protein
MVDSRGKEKADGSEKEMPEPSLKERLEGLKLQGEEEYELNFVGEFEELVKDVHWLALFCVHTTKPFSHAALFGAMRIAWVVANEVTFNVLGPNLFLVQLQCLRDWTRVMDGSPWLFRGAAIVIEEYDGFSNVNSYKLERIPI